MRKITVHLLDGNKVDLYKDYDVAKPFIDYVFSRGIAYSRDDHIVYYPASQILKIEIAYSEY